MKFEAKDALVMIPRAPIKSGSQQAVSNPLSHTVGGADSGADEPDGPSAGMPPRLDFSAAVPPKKSSKRAEVKNRDWRASIQAYNEL